MTEKNVRGVPFFASLSWACKKGTNNHHGTSPYIFLHSGSEAAHCPPAKKPQSDVTIDAPPVAVKRWTIARFVMPLASNSST